MPSTTRISMHAPPTGSDSQASSSFKYFNLLDSECSDESSLSCSSEYTSTSASTNPGPGSLSGKGVLAFGKMVQRALDGVTIRRRLPEIKRLFPHSDHDTTIDGFDKLYADVLELSRCDLYSDKIRKQALRLILIQIANRNTVHLIKSTVKWPPYEIYLLLTDILMSMPPSWLSLSSLNRHDRTKMHERLCRGHDRYLISIGQSNGAMSLAIFMCDLARASKGACQAVLEAGFLDVLLAMRFLELEFDPSQLSPYTARDLALWDGVFTATPGASQIFSGHSLQHFWPKQKWDSRHLLDRQEAWKLKHYHTAVQLRVVGISNAVRRMLIDRTSAPLDVFADLLEFLSSDTVDPAVWEHLRENIVLLTNQYSPYMKAFLNSECEGITDMLSRAFHCIFMEANTSSASHESSNHLIAAIVRCATSAGMGSHSRKQIILDAGILSLLLVLLPEELSDLSVLPTAPTTSPSKFLEAIRTHGLIYFLKVEPTPWRNSLINAFRVFFDSPDPAPADGDSSDSSDPFTYMHYTSALSSSSFSSQFSQLTSATVMSKDTVRPSGTVTTSSGTKSALYIAALVRVRKLASRRMKVLTQRKREDDG